MKESLLYGLLLLVPFALSASGCGKSPEADVVNEQGLKTIFADGELEDELRAPEPAATRPTPAPKPAAAPKASPKPAPASVETLALLELPQLPALAEDTGERVPLTPKDPGEDLAELGRSLLEQHVNPPHWQLKLNTSLELGACVMRELHDGQWLAGGCRDVVHVLHRGKKAAHLGAALMSNAQRGNTSLMMKAGVDLGGAGAVLADAATAVSPHLEEIRVPPWLSKAGSAVSIDFMGGWRPVHDSSVRGDWAYGVGAHVEIPIDKAFEWLKAGL